jgi:hypothetical protein
MHEGHAHGGGTHCASCQHAAEGGYSGNEVLGNEVLRDESGLTYGDISQGISAPSISQPSPTPATPRSIETPRSNETLRSNETPSLQQPSLEQPALPNSIPATGSSAQQRMKLHQRSDRSDPNGKLSVQMVNGQRRLVVQPQ